MRSKRRAEELLRIYCDSQAHNPAWFLQELLAELAKQLSEQGTDCSDEQSMMYTFGWYDCVSDIKAICQELEQL